METTVPVKYKKDEMLDAVSRKIKYTFKNVHRAKSTHTHVRFIYTRCSVIWCQTVLSIIMGFHLVSQILTYAPDGE